MVILLSPGSVCARAYTHTHTYTWERFQTEVAVPVKSPQWDVSRLHHVPKEAAITCSLIQNPRVFPTELCGRVLGRLGLFPQSPGPAGSGPTTPVHIPAMRTWAKRGYHTPVVPRSPPTGTLGLLSGLPVLAVRSSSLLVFRKTPANGRSSRAEDRVYVNPVGMSIKVQLRPAQPSAREVTLGKESLRLPGVGKGRAMC